MNFVNPYIPPYDLSLVKWGEHLNYCRIYFSWISSASMVRNLERINVSIICGITRVKGFISIHGVENVYFKSPDDHFPEIYFIFYL